MIYPTNDLDLAVLHLRVDDKWSVQEFAELLTLVVEAYEPIEQLHVLSRVVDQEVSNKAQEPVWNALYSNAYTQPFGRNFDDLLKSMRPFRYSLTVGAISISSPGWIEVIGSFNPLKTIADFITHCREEKTKRMDIDAKVYIASEHEKTERLRIKAELATNILTLMPEHSRPETAYRVVDISQAVIEPSMKALESVVRDERVQGAEVRRLGQGSTES
jgi:hypothetical protein